MKRHILPVICVLLLALLMAIWVVEVGAYDRSSWPHWADLDNDCQDERAEALIRYSSTPVTFRTQKGCVVDTGTWHCSFTGKVFYSAARLDVDHLVPLENASKSGAQHWPREKKYQFANDQENLIPVYLGANRSKGSRGPEEWTPPNKDFSRQYALTWIYIKEKYQLAYTEAELLALALLLQPVEMETIHDNQTPK
jgi:hypothetical protein